jgi:hypothetical protein
MHPGPFAPEECPENLTNLTGRRTMTTTNVNGRVRKSLAEQIDRLDQILDGLADGLNEAVAMAVKEAVSLAVKEAVQAVLAEVLTNPAVREPLGGVGSPSVPPADASPKSGWRQRLGQAGAWIGRRLGAVCQAVAALPRRACQACATMVLRVRQACAALWVRVQLVRYVEVQLLTALGLGSAAGAAAYLAGPWLAASVNALGGLMTPLVVRAGLWLQRAWGLSSAGDA